MTSTYCDRAVRDDLPDGIYEWFRQLTGFEFRWNLGVISDLTPDDFDLVYDHSHSIPVVYALEQEDMSYIHERVKVCGGGANLVIRGVDGTVSMLAVRSLSQLDPYGTTGMLLASPPDAHMTLGHDDEGAAR